MKSTQTLYFHVLLLILLLSPGFAFPQAADNAALSGRITDPDGLPIVSVRVEAINTGTNTVYSGETNETGLYYLPVIPPGSYRLILEKEGFQRIVQTGVELHVADSLAMNFILPIGSMTQSITVMGDVVPMVNTTNSALGAVINEQKVEDLPLNGRNYVDLTLLEPGVMKDGAVASGQGLGTVFSSNGNTPWSNYFTLDGASLMNALAAGTASAAQTTLGVDGLQEFKMVSMPSADYGMVMGAQVVMVSKAGTNRFHGDAFDYLRNSIFDARNFFDYGYLIGGPRLPHLVRNDFGAAFGGPIRNDKTFFYGAYEGIRLQTGISTVDTVPGANCHGPANAVVWNGQGTQPAGSIGPCAQLGANPAGAGTNSVTIWPATAGLLSLFPAPNLPNNQYFVPSTDPTTANWLQMRVDQNFSASDAMFARYTFDKESYVLSAVSLAGQAFPDMFKTQDSSLNYFLTVAENHIFSPTLLNSARLSGSRTTLQYVNVFPNGAPIGPNLSFAQGFPTGFLQVSGLAAMGTSNSTPKADNMTVYTLSDDLFYTKGRHAFKFGTLMNRFYQGANTNASAQGKLAFSSLATFLRGLPSSYSQLALPNGQVLNPSQTMSNIQRYYAYNTFGFYAQDDWRALSRLTLNLGLRYEFATDINELNGNGYAVRNIATDTAAVPGPIIANATYHNISPRVGFAYDVTGKGKTSIRGGFGIYYDIGNLGSEIREQAQGTPPLEAQNTVTSPKTPLTLPFTFPAGSIGKSLQILQYNGQAPHALEYSLTVEQQLPFGVGLSVSYVGLRGIHLWTRGEGNPVIPTSFLNGNQATPFYAANITSCSNVVPSCRVNPNFTTVTYDSTLGNSFYHALQVNVAKRLTHGIEFQAAYTWSKSLDDTEDMGQIESSPGCATGTDPWDRKVSYGPSCFDATNNLRINVMYHFPTFHGNRLVAKVANGWWVGNIVSLQSGYPFTPLLSANRSRNGIGVGPYSDYANVNTAASIAATFPSTCTSMPGQPPAGANPCQYTPIPFNSKTVNTGKPNQWFNPAMFSLGPVGELGNASRDMLRGPGLANWDFSLVKDTKIGLLGENGSLQFRAEFFNILNRANFNIPTNATVFSGSTADTGAYSEVPMSTAGQITATSTSSRQIQFALKLLF